MNNEFNLDLIDQSFQKYRVDDILPATIVATTSEGIIVNIGGKNDGLIAYPEATEYLNLAKGSKLEVVVLSGKATDGCISVSAKKAETRAQANALIPDIKKGAKFEAIVDSSNSGGLTCFFGSYRVFVPAAEIEEFFVRDLSKYKGKKLELVATDFDEEKREIIASRRVIIAGERAACEELFWHSIFINKLVNGVVTHLKPFGAFVCVDGVDCLVHKSEISYDKNCNIADVLEVGREYTFRVISLDRETKKVALSYKQMGEHPFDEKVQALSEGDIVRAEIVKILPFGAIAKLENGLEGLIHISEISADSYVKNVHEVCKVGEVKDVVVRLIDLENKKLSLSIKALAEMQN